MNNKKTTKRALLSSVMAMLICITMLIGTTFAWFTDSASTAVNKIQAGNLDVQLLMHDGRSYVDIGNDTSPIFGIGSIAQNNNAETLWEPGKTQVAYLAIKNNGNLALKYKVELNVTNVSKDMYKAMKYAIIPDAQPSSVTYWTDGSTVVAGTQHVSDDVSLPVGVTHYFALAIHMNEDAGNEYQGGEVDFDLTVVATQDTVENDSFGNVYDAGAVYSVSVKTQADLDNALNSDGAVKITIEKGANVAINDVDFVGKNAGTTVANYGTLTVSRSTIYSTDANAQGRHAITNYGTLTVDNSTLGSLQSRGNAIRNYGTATIKDSALTCCDNYLNGGYAYVFANSAGTMTIENCSYTGAANGVFAADGGNIIINSGTYKLTGARSFYMFYMWEGTITVNGGTFEKSGNTYGMAYATDGGINDQLTINGGTLTYNGAEWSLS